MIWPALRATAYGTRRVHAGAPYSHRLQQKAKEKGLDLEVLISRAREETRHRQKDEAASLLASFKKPDPGLTRVVSRPTPPEGAGASGTRKDSSPVKPLASILNLSKLMATPHTPSQISALWTAYHASRTKGTGRGYICASLPLESYNAMSHVAKRYPVFVIPVPRESSSDRSADGNTGTAHEFFFLQWDFHPPPSAPSAMQPTPFEPATGSGGSSHIPETSTVLFTPLQEYKLRTSFATPYLVLTFYTDMSQSHGIVLLRGEITPSSSSAAAQPGQGDPERFLLNPVDAQLLVMGLQRFYLWGDVGKEGDRDLTAEMLLKQFHENPQNFSWQDILKFTDVTA